MPSKFIARITSLSRGRQVSLAVVALVVIGAIAAAVALTTTGPKSAAPVPTTNADSTPSSSTTTTGLSVPAGNCPLTDVRAPDGVPDRPALAIKIGNEPLTSRPQSGLNEADIVFDTPAEGFIMRYVAVYQCTDASLIGPNRSVRWVDWHLIRQFRHPILAFAGGINPDVDTVASFRWMKAADLLTNAASAGIRTTNRTPPDNLYTSTTALYALAGAFDKRYGPPPPIFRYSAQPAAASTPLAAMHINFSYDTDVTWTWNAALGEWVHSYSTGADIDALTNSPVTTTNVVVLIVHFRFGRYLETPGGSGDFESETLGSGPGYILRNGRVLKMTWHRRYITQPWTFTANGQRLALAPGRTWVELVPNTTAQAPGALTLSP